MPQITKATCFGSSSLVTSFWLISSEFNHWIQAATFIKSWTARDSQATATRMQE